MKRLLAMTILTALLITLMGCGRKPLLDTSKADGSTGPTDESATAATEASASAETSTLPDTEPAAESETVMESETQLADDLAAYRQVLLDHGAVCGVIFLGAIDWDAPGFTQDPDSWEEFLINCGYAEDFRFLSEIPGGRILDAGGNEVYCFFPVDDNAAVSVRRAELDEESALIVGTNDVLMECIDGAPFVVCCNVSDIIPNAQVTVMTENGSILWEPFLSLENGHVYIPEGVPLYDATVYPYE